MVKFHAAIPTNQTGLPAVRPSIAGKFIALAPEAHRALAHIKRTISQVAGFLRILFELQPETSIAALHGFRAQRASQSNGRALQYLDATADPIAHY
jgi:hypothetical protein